MLAGVVERECRARARATRRGGRSTRAWARFRPAPSGPSAAAGRRTAAAGTHLVAAALERLRQALEREVGERRDRRRTRTRCASSGHLGALRRRGLPARAPLSERRHTARLRRRRGRPGGDLVERAQAASHQPVRSSIRQTLLQGMARRGAASSTALTPSPPRRPPARRSALELGRRQPEHAVRVPGRGPDLVEAEQLAVDQRHRRRGVADRRDAADREAGAAPSRTPRRRGRARPTMRRDLRLVDAPVARGDDEHRARRRCGAGRRRSWRSGRPRRRARRPPPATVRAATSRNSGACGWPQLRQRLRRRARKPSGRCCDVHARHAASASPRLASSALPTRDTGLRPSTLGDVRRRRRPARRGRCRSRCRGRRSMNSTSSVRDVAGRALRVRAAAEPGDAGVEGVDAELEAGVDVRERLAVGVVEMAADLGERDSASARAPSPPARLRGVPTPMVSAMPQWSTPMPFISRTTRSTSSARDLALVRAAERARDRAAHLDAGVVRGRHDRARSARCSPRSSS